MRGPFDPSGPQTDWRSRLALWLLVAAIVLAYPIAGAIWGNGAVPWVLGGYAIIFMFAAVRQAFRIGRREWQASRTFPIQSEPSPGFTPLEVEAIRLIGEVSGHSGEIVRHLSSAEVSLRWNTGSGCLVKLEGASPPLSNVAMLDEVAWFSLEGVRAPVGFRIWHTDGVVDLIEAFCGGYSTPDVDWRKAAFTAALSPPGNRGPVQRPLAAAWMLEEIERARADGEFDLGEVRLR